MDATLYRTAIGAQFAYALPVDPKNNLFRKTDPISDVVQERNFSLRGGDGLVTINPSPLPGVYDIEGWLEQLSVPWRLSDALRVFYFEIPVESSLRSAELASINSTIDCIKIPDLDSFLRESSPPQRAVRHVSSIESFRSSQEASNQYFNPSKFPPNTLYFEPKESQYILDLGVSNSFQDSRSDLGSNSSCFSSVSQESGKSHFSGTSWASADSHASWSGRKGKPRQPKSPTYMDHHNYFCTWYFRGFTKKSDWRRHEESLPAPQKEWVCMPDGPLLTLGGIKFCALCHCSDPDDDHLKWSHGISTCLERPLHERRFDRKDHLVQHLSGMHKISISNNPALSRDIKTWERPFRAPAMKELWDCGFCQEDNMTWTQRYKHVANHMESPGVKSHLWQWPKHLFLCTRSNCTVLLDTFQGWKMHEQSWHPSIYNFWICKDQDALYPSLLCYQVCSNHTELDQHQEECHQAKRLGSRAVNYLSYDYPFDYETNIFWCGYCRAIVDLHETSLDIMDRFSHIKIRHVKRQGIEQWYPMETRDKEALERAITKTISNGVAQRFSELLPELRLGEEHNTDPALLEVETFLRHRLRWLRQWSSLSHLPITSLSPLSSENARDVGNSEGVHSIKRSYQPYFGQESAPSRAFKTRKTQHQRKRLD